LLYRLLVEKIILPLGDLMLGSKTISYLNKFRKWQWLAKADVEKLQKERLQKLLVHASTTIPFYKTLNTNPESDPYTWLRQFPVLKKPVIKENIDGFTSVPKEKLLKFSSSGSSGVQGVVYMNKKEHSYSRALQILWWEWAGYKIGKPLLQTGMTLNRGFVKGTKDFLFRTTYVSAFGLAEKDMLAALNKFRNKKNAHLGGYASSLYVIAEIAKRTDIKDIHFDSAISW
jgi:phenylacetate-CoA ligase